MAASIETINTVDIKATRWNRFRCWLVGGFPGKKRWTKGSPWITGGPEILLPRDMWESEPRYIIWEMVLDHGRWIWIREIIATATDLKAMYDRGEIEVHELN